MKIVPPPSLLLLKSVHTNTKALIISYQFCSVFHPTDIQEFYELTLLDDTKTIQQKTVETLQIASKWEQENSLKINASEVSNKYG